MNKLQLIPCKFCHFYNLNDWEFNIANGLRSVQFNQLIDTDLFNLISNPDKSDETDPDLMLTIPMSNYYSISQINNAIAKAGPKAISMFHCNMRSLQKNLALLEDFIYSLDKRPEILAITETRLNEHRKQQLFTNLRIALHQSLNILFYTTEPWPIIITIIYPDVSFLNLPLLYFPAVPRYRLHWSIKSDFAPDILLFSTSFKQLSKE